MVEHQLFAYLGDDTGRRGRYPDRLPIGAQRSVVHDLLRGIAHVLPDAQVDLLVQCRTFRTLADHAVRICRGEPPERHAATTDVLRHLADEGLLFSHDDLVRRCGAIGQLPARNDHVASLSVLTRDRPASLLRCVRSYASNLREYGRKLPILVADDSYDPLVRRANWTALQNVVQEFDIPIEYIGRDQKHAYAALLATKYAHPDGLASLVPGANVAGTYGANRNAVMLATAGKMALMVDDDTLCRVAPHPEREERLQIASTPPGIDYSFYPDRDTAFRSAAFAPHDVIALHERLLGRTLGECTRDSASAIDIHLPNTRLERALRLQAGSVLLTTLGLVGDSANTSPYSRLLMEGPSLEHRSPIETAHRITSTIRDVFTAVPRPTLDSGGFLMGYCLGLDNRTRLLPPFMPVGRNEDAVFLATTLRCHATAMLGRLPYAIVHDPAEPRAYDPEVVSRGLTGLRISELLVALLRSDESLESAPRDPASRMRRTGAWLQEIGSLPDDDYRARLRVVSWNLLHARSSMLEGLLASELPGPLARLLGDQLLRVRRSIESPDFPASYDLVPGAACNVIRQAERRVLTELGRLLLAWPDLVEAAADLRQAGRTIAVPVGQAPLP